MSDWELLQEYVRSGSDSAFAELVERHIRWVHLVCTRQLRDAHLAEDVTQAVFLLLSQKGARLPAGTSISGWLYRAARLTSSNAMQSQRRRAKREATYAAQQPTEEASTNPSSDSALVVAIESGLSRLRQGDRELLILHFYGNKPLTQAAAELGISVEAARKRFTRAMNGLKELIAQQGVSVPSVGGAAALMSVLESTSHSLPKALSAWLAGGASPSAVSSGAVAIAKSVALKSTTTLLIAATGALMFAVAIIAFIMQLPARPPTIARTPAPPPAITQAPQPQQAPLNFVATPLVGHNMPVIGVTVSPKGQFAASRSFSEIVRWDLAASKAIGTPFPTVPQPAAVAVGDTGLVVALDRRDIVIFDSPAALTPRRISPTPGRPAIHWSLAIAPDGREIGVGDADGSIHLLDLKGGDEVSAFPLHTHAVNTLSFSPDGQSILSGGMDDHTIVLSDRATGKEIHRFEGHSSLIAALGFSPDGQSAFSFGRNIAAAPMQTPPPPTGALAAGKSIISVWNLSTGAEQQALAAPANLITAATFTPDGAHLAAVCDNKIVVWDVTTGNEIARHPLPDARNIALAASFSRDGRRVLLGGGIPRGNTVDLVDLKAALTQLSAGK